MAKMELKEELEKEAKKYAEGMAKYYASTHEDYIPSQFEKYLRNAYISSAEPREKRIAELEEEKQGLKDYCDKYTKTILSLRQNVAELEAQIEKMKKCIICKHYSSISGCSYHSNWVKDCKENGMKLFELKEINN